jgi:hypothetical protein
MLLCCYREERRGGVAGCFAVWSFPLTISVKPYRGGFELFDLATLRFFYDKRGRYGGSRSTVQMRGMGCKLPTQLAYCISYSPFGEENRDHFLSRRKEKKIMVKTSLIKISIFRLYS